MSSFYHLLARGAYFCTRAGLSLPIVIAAMLSLITAAQAFHSSTPHPFKSASIEWNPESDGRAPPVRLMVGHNGAKYTHLEGDVETRFRIKAKVKAFHRIVLWVVTTVDPYAWSDAPNEAIGATDGTYVKELDSGNIHFKMDASTLVNTGIPGISTTQEQDIINMCNDAFNELPTEPKTLENVGFNIEVHLGVRAEKKGWGNATIPDPAVAFTTFPIRIVCQGAPAGMAHVPEVKNIDIRVEEKSETCPKKTEVTAYVDYEEETTAHIRAVKQGHVGRAAPWVEVKTREVTLGPKAWHRAEHTFPFDLDPGKHTFRVEVEHGPTSDWETIDLECPPFDIVFTSLEYETEEKQTCPKQVEETAIFTTNGPGTIDYAIKLSGTEWAVRSGSVKATRHGDGYRAVIEHVFPQNAIDKFMTVEATDISGPNAPGPLANASAQMTVKCLEVLSGMLDLRGFEATACEGEAALSIRTNQPGDVPYLLDCTGGKTWSGTVQAKETGPDTFIGVDTKRFDVTNNEQVNCALKTAKPMPVTVLTLKERKYECLKPADIGATEDLAPAPRPVRKKPDSAPPVPKPQISCANGTVKNGACVCPRGHKRTAAGKNAWRCVKSVVITPPKVVPEPKQITCANGRVRNGTCVCPRAHKRIKAGKNAWRCVKAAVVKPPEVPIGCVNGQVKSGTCVCPRAHKRVKVGQNAWRCVKAAAPDRSKTDGAKTLSPLRLRPADPR